MKSLAVTITLTVKGSAGQPTRHMGTMQVLTDTGMHRHPRTGYSLGWWLLVMPFSTRRNASFKLPQR